MSIRKRSGNEGKRRELAERGVGVTLSVSDHVGMIGLNDVTRTHLSWDSCNDGESHAV